MYIKYLFSLSPDWKTVTHTYHPTLPDHEALVLVRAAMDTRSAAIKAVADMQGQQNAPQYGSLTSPPLLKFKPCTASGLVLFFDGLPMSIISEWGSIQIAESCSDEITPKQCKEVLQRLAERGVAIDLDGDPDTEYLLSGNIRSVGGKLLPPVSRTGHGAFRTFTEATRAFRAACNAMTGR
jgi:hypothetical protein